MKYVFYLKKFWLIYVCTAVVIMVITFGTSDAVTTAVQNTPIPRSMRIVIDAGHGGEDGGAISCSGVPESQINLEIALRLNDLLHLFGYDTCMVRSADISIYTEGKTIAQRKLSDLKQRVKIVNETDHAILISIHQNTFPIEKYCGAQVFYNDVQPARAMAEHMQETFTQTINPGSNRQCKKADGIYLMQQVKQPALLVECGFLSNPEEEQRLRDGQYQQKICCVIASALCSYVSA